MLRQFLILIILLGLCACKEKAALKHTNDGLPTLSGRWAIDSLVEGSWKVGRLYRNTVTKHMTAVIELPILEKADAEQLFKTYELDGWIIKVLQRSHTGTEIELAQLFVPFFAPQKSRTSHLPVKAISFALTYASYAISERFRRFQCPAFSHNLQVSEWEITGDASALEFDVFPGAKFHEKLHRSELVPTALNIGNTMIGEYSLKAAIYSSRRQQLHSSFQALPQTIKIKREDSVTIDGCAGIHQEYDPPPPGLLLRR